MIFQVLPNVENLTGLFLMNAVCFTPALLRIIFSSRRGQTEFKKMFTILFDLMAILFQASIWFIFVAVKTFDLKMGDELVEKKYFLLNLVVSTLLISLGWWENFAQVRFTTNRVSFFIQSQISDLRKHNAKIYVVANVLKVVFTFLFAYFLMPHGIRSELENMTNELNLTNADNLVKLAILESDSNEIVRQDLFQGNASAFYPMIIHIISTAICFFTGRVACKLLMQCVGFSLPLSLTTPLAFVVILVLSALSNFDTQIKLCNGELSNFFFLDGFNGKF